MISLNKIYNENCLATMSKIKANYVDCTITSPPYDNLRDYNGYSFDFKSVSKELYRVTKEGGIVVWVVGDETKKFCESLTSFKQAIYFVEDCGFNLLDTMIYHKRNYAPAFPPIRRYANTFEYMFVLSKGKPENFKPIQHPKAESSLGNNKITAMRLKNGRLVTKRISSLRQTKDACNVWTLTPSKSKDAKDHPAVFPEQLVRDHLLTWTKEYDIVYDPFMGSGTVAKVALLNRRSFIGSEISKEYCNIAYERLEGCFSTGYTAANSIPKFTKIKKDLIQIVQQNQNKKELSYARN